MANVNQQLSLPGTVGLYETMHPTQRMLILSCDQTLHELAASLARQARPGWWEVTTTDSLSTLFRNVVTLSTQLVVVDTRSTGAIELTSILNVLTNIVALDSSLLFYVREPIDHDGWRIDSSSRIPRAIVLHGTTVPLEEAFNRLLSTRQCFIDQQAFIRSAQTNDPGLSPLETKILTDVVSGYTDWLIAERHNLGLRTVQCYVSSLFKKLINGQIIDSKRPAQARKFNLRARLVAEAIIKKRIETHSLSDVP